MTVLRVLSLFSGAGGGDLGAELAGCQVVGLCEIERHARAVLRFRWPDVPLHDDVATLDGTAWRGKVDVVLGGSPCQDLSVAGKRAGLAGERSSLFHEQVRIWRETDAPYLIWENVPGAYSSNAGRDFAAVLSALVGATIPTPANGWRSGGVAAGRTAVAAWRTLDAQFFGVAQRRARVFVVAARSGADPAEVLALAEGVHRRAPASGEAGQDAAARLGDGAAGGGWPACIAPTLNAHFGDKLGLENQHALGGAGLFVPCVAHTLRGEGHDASEYGSGRGVPLVACHDVAGTRASRQCAGGGLGTDMELSGGVVAFKSGQSEAAGGTFVTWEISPTLQGQNNGSTAVPAIALHLTQGPISGQVAPRHGATSGGMGVVAHAIQERAVSDTSGPGGLGVQREIAYTQEARHRPQSVAYGMTVRRLTPRECERLMGWPDDHTAQGISEKGQPYRLADGPRYKLCGNGMATPVVAWVFDRLVKAEQWGTHE